jgi:serine/threonine-protein kinase
LPPPLIEKGQLIFGTYLLEELIGEGGMGQVWLVTNLELDRKSALKLIKPEIAQNDKGWRRFEREARLMAKLTHPNAVGVYAFRRTHSIGYIEMEYVRGRSLDRCLAERKGQPMDLDWTAQLLYQLCSLLQEAHGYIDEERNKAKPIIHRDLKPSNLMLVDKKPDGQNLKVLDFGVAKMIEDDGSPELTGPLDLVGTPAYMSPEQIQGGTAEEGKGEIDGRSDLYSVGVLLYQLLTGTLPFPGMSKHAVLAAHIYNQPRPMHEANPRDRVPAPVERVVMSCLEKDPDRRPQSARELADSFRAAVGVAPGPQLPWKTLASFAAVACLVISFMVWAGSGRFPPVVPINGSGSKLSVHPPPPGYEVLTEDDLQREISKKKAAVEDLLSPLPENEPAGLRREHDNAVFYCFRIGIYLPVRYKPEDPKHLDGSWPKALIRSDGVKFIRISGGSYMRGDFISPGKPANDLKGNPLTPHNVEISGFYIQENEVTNHEIEGFEDEIAADSLAEWRKAVKLWTEDFKKSPNEVRDYPAVCINRITAQDFATSWMGRLPTEAEWEYAARSCGQNCRWAGQNPVARRKVPKAHLFPGEPVPVPVKSFAGEDETDQNVFDMTGNVREWCLDCYRPYSDIIREHKNADPAGTDQTLQNPCECREATPEDLKLPYVVRGGSYLDSPDDAMTFQRRGFPANSELTVGFRVVIECPPERRPPVDAE